MDVQQHQNFFYDRPERCVILHFETEQRKRRSSGLFVSGRDENGKSQRRSDVKVNRFYFLTKKLLFIVNATRASEANKWVFYSADSKRLRDAARRKLSDL